MDELPDQLILPSLSYQSKMVQLELY